MNLDSAFLTNLVLIAILAVVALVIYAVLLSLSNRHSRLDTLRKRSDLKGLVRVANDPGLVENVRLEAINLLAEIGAYADDPDLLKESVTLLIQLFLSSEEKYSRTVITALNTMDSRIQDPSFRELVLQELNQVEWRTQTRQRRRLILHVLKKFSAARDAGQKPHPVSVHSLMLMSELAADESMRLAVLGALRKYLEDPESGVHQETTRALTALAMRANDPKTQEAIVEILSEAYKNPGCKDRLSVVQALGKLGIESRSIRLRAMVTSALVIGLQDEDGEVRQEAVDQLKNLNTLTAATETRAKIADALILALQNPDLSVRQRALDALAETYLWAETAERMERTIKAIILAMYDTNPHIFRQAAKMLSRMESRLEPGTLLQQVGEAFLAGLQSPDEELRFLSADALMKLYRNGRLSQGLRALIRAQKEIINETGVMSADNRVGKCPQCGKNVLLKHARLVRRGTAYRYFCRECYLPPADQVWPENALQDPQGQVIEDQHPPESESW